MSVDELQTPDLLASAADVETLRLLGDVLGALTFGERQNTIGDAELVDLAAGETSELDIAGGFASVAIVNLNRFPVFLGEGSQSGASGRELAQVPGAAWMVLPLKGRRLSLGSGSSAGSVYVIPFWKAQPFAAGTLAGSGGAAGPAASTVSKDALTGATQTLLAANPARAGAAIYCDAATTLYVKLGDGATADDWTVKLAQDDYYRVPDGYTGIVTGFAAAAVGQARVTELS